MPDFSSIHPMKINSGMARRIILDMFSRIEGGKSIRNLGPLIMSSERIPNGPKGERPRGF